MKMAEKLSSSLSRVGSVVLVVFLGSPLAGFGCLLFSVVPCTSSSLIVSMVGIFGFNFCDEEFRLRVILFNPIARKGEISGGGGRVEVGGVSSASSSRRLRFLGLLPLERVT